MNKNDPVFVDLSKLALTRTEQAISSVIQLADDEKLTYSIIVTVACNLVDDAADLMIAAMTKEGLNVPTKEAAYGFIFKEFLEAYGIDWQKRIKEGWRP